MIVSAISDAREHDAPRVAVIGDVGGHLAALRFELFRLGADPHTGTLPPGLTVVQVGDLVHRGPDSEGVVALVDRYLREQPGQWIQIVGNHEAFYLTEPMFHWRERVTEATAASIRQTHLVGAASSQQVNAASSAAIAQTAPGSLLIAHSQQINQASTASVLQTHLIGVPNSQQINTAIAAAISTGGFSGSLSDADIQRIVGAVIAALNATSIPVNIKQVNSVPIKGSGVVGDTWGPV